MISIRKSVWKCGRDNHPPEECHRPGPHVAEVEQQKGQPQQKGQQHQPHQPWYPPQQGKGKGKSVAEQLEPIVRGNARTVADSIRATHGRISELTALQLCVIFQEELLVQVQQDNFAEA